MRWSSFLAGLLLITGSYSHAAATAATKPTSIIVETQMAGSREAVADVKVRWESSDSEGRGKTSAIGQYTIEEPSDPPDYIKVWVSHEGLVPLFVFWQRPEDVTLGHAAVIPHFLFRMEKGKQIGGVVVDSAGNPVAGAKVFIQVRKKYDGLLQEVGIPWYPKTTDAQGRWSFSGVPPDAEQLRVGVYDLMHLTDDWVIAVDYVPRSNLFDGTARLTLPTATPLQVTVLKPDGTPAAGAEVFFGSNKRIGNCIAPAKTDAQGKARFGFTPGVSRPLTASLAGYGPVQQTILVEQKTHQITLKLTNPRERTLEVVDSSGIPIQGAGVNVSTWHGIKVLSVRLETDNAGKAIWKESPDDEVTADVYADGYVDANVVWSADPVTRVTLFPPTSVTGRVVDDQTNEPIKTYAIRAAAVWSEGQRMIWQDDSFTAQAKKEPGKFDLKMNFPAFRYLLRVQPDGYLPADTDLFALNGSSRNFEFRVKRAAPIMGTVITSDNHLVAGADVYLVNSGESLILDNGAVRDGYSSNCCHTKTTEDGRFSLPPQKEDFALVALSDAGSATIRRDEIVGKNGIIRLAAWAKVRGTIKVNGAPAADMAVQGSAPPITLGDETPILYPSFRFQTDNSGGFELSRIPAGRITFWRDVSNRSAGRTWGVRLGTLDASSGESYQCKFGDGISVFGQLQIPACKNWMVRQARIEPKDRPRVSECDNIEVMDDGQFRADGLGPGTYALRIALHEFPPDNACGWGRLVAEYDKELNIGAAEAPLNIGTLTPDPIADSDLKVGDLAPDFSVKTLQGENVRLADLKGKVVLVDFWASWCAPCNAEMPDLQKLALARSGDRNFLLLGLSLDNSEQDLRGYVKRAKIPSQQAWVGIDAQTVRAYGATAIPANFLIGPDGRIAARDLRGEDLSRAVATALGN